MQIKLIILDFDGTLASTADAHTKAYIMALKESGIRFSEEEIVSSACVAPNFCEQ